MLFENSKDTSEASYWLADSSIYTDAGYGWFGIRCVESTKVGDISVWVSEGSTDYYECGVRAVVSLSSTIQVTGSSETGWIY